MGYETDAMFLVEFPLCTKGSHTNWHWLKKRRNANFKFAQSAKSYFEYCKLSCWQSMNNASFLEWITLFFKQLQTKKGCLHHKMIKGEIFTTVVQTTLLWMHLLFGRGFYGSLTLNHLKMNPLKRCWNWYKSKVELQLRYDLRWDWIVHFSAFSVSGIIECLISLWFPIEIFSNCLSLEVRKAETIFFSLWC